MRKFALLLITMAAAAAAPALAQDKLGKRTAPPQQLFAGIGEGVSDAELERAVAAASAFPLGSLRNPVRVGGPDAALAYVARLRCADGKAPAAAPGKPGGTGAFGSVVALHALDCGAAAPGRFDLFIDIYHEEHVEDRAPDGFALRPR
jgi:hypothetical protein